MPSLLEHSLSLATTALKVAKSTYDGLAERGEQVLARRRGDDPWAAVADPAPETIDVTAVTDPFGLPDDVAEAVADATPGAVLGHDELPLEDYDHLTLGSLRARLAKLDAVALVQLRDYERAHAHRIPVLTMLENRLAKVAAQ